MNLNKSRGEGSHFRRNFSSFLGVGAVKVFETEDEEYQYIGKFGRGMWDVELLESHFNDEEMATIKTIANGFGAFDY